MSDIKAKMHQIRFRLGSAPDPAGELTALPRSSIWWGGAGCPLPKNPTPALGPLGLAASVRAWKFFTNFSPCQ